ncbi:MAG TPA: glucosidase, partial [Clostridia bacterium]|nr:glucosidase [Clostridia bacterium]
MSSSRDTRGQLRPLNAEKQRLAEAAAGRKKWKRWGPYVSERQWGTVREDYSPHGNAWEYFPHDHARSRAYRWGEDGLAGICDDQQRLCLGLALWNGRDPILKERLFGLTNGEGNHGEDVKEAYYYLDATPTHSYLKMLYKYPQQEFPYARLAEENRRRSKDQPEFELLDTGVFENDRYFDVFVEYAKATPEDLLTLVTVQNRGPESQTVFVLPQLWFRNTWSWQPNGPKPELWAEAVAIAGRHQELGTFRLYCEGEPEFLCCENETNVRRLYGQPVANGFFKDAFHAYVVEGNKNAANPKQVGTKAGALYRCEVPAQSSICVRLRWVLAPRASASKSATVPGDKNGRVEQPAVVNAFSDFEEIFEQRRREADEFYAELQEEVTDPDARLVQRQAFAGMIWSKQFYYYDVPDWLKGDPTQPQPPAERRHGRNWEWQHLNNADVLSMPDKWEYPWYAAWDLAFHCLPLAMVDAEFAKDQLVLLTREWYMHPNGQLPAYEWAFGDVNPPVHAWAAWRVFQIDRKQRGDSGDLAFLERVFHKLMLNFTWWVNRKDAQGRNIFQGGFLGLDNIGVFDRSAPLPTGGFINQADGTSWMAMYCLNLMRIALELATHNKVYEDIATKFFEHFLHIAEAMNNIGDDGIGLWCERDGFYYDVLNLPCGEMTPLEVRSLVGLIPLFAVETLEPDLLARLPDFSGRLQWFLNYRPDLAKLVSRWYKPRMGERHLLSLLRGHRMKCLLRRMLDETEFLSDYGVRSLSRYHLEHPYEYWTSGTRLCVSYEPAESRSGLFGGNSNWRGPVWMPVNYLIIESLQKFHHYYGDDFKIECPTGSGKFMTINEVANELAHRLMRLFLKDENGERPVLRQHDKLAK